VQRNTNREVTEVTETVLQEFNAGIKRLAQENNPVPADAQTPAEPLDGAMNPPEQHVRGQRRRRTRS